MIERGNTMSKLYGAIVWHDDNGMITLALEKRKTYTAYPGESYVTFLTGPNFSDLTIGDSTEEQLMKDRAKQKGIELTTDRIAVRRK